MGPLACRKFVFSLGIDNADQASTHRGDMKASGGDGVDYARALTTPPIPY
jgi:hypothetical protein